MAAVTGIRPRASPLPPFDQKAVPLGLVLEELAGAGHAGHGCFIQCR